MKKAIKLLILILSVTTVSAGKNDSTANKKSDEIPTLNILPTSKKIKKASIKTTVKQNKDFEIAETSKKIKRQPIASPDKENQILDNTALNSNSTLLQTPKTTSVLQTSNSDVSSNNYYPENEIQMFNSDVSSNNYDPENKIQISNSDVTKNDYIAQLWTTKLINQMNCIRPYDPSNGRQYDLPKINKLIFAPQESRILSTSTENIPLTQSDLDLLETLSLRAEEKDLRQKLDDINRDIALSNAKRYCPSPIKEPAFFLNLKNNNTNNTMMINE